MTRRRRYVVAVVVLAIITPWIAVCVVFRGDVGFEPARFLEEYAKFVATLLAVALSFFLVYMYWHAKEAREQAKRTLVSLKTCLTQLLNAMLELTSLLQEEVGDEEELRGVNEHLEGLRWKLIQSVAHTNAVEAQSWTQQLSTAETAIVQSWVERIEPPISSLLDVPRWRYSNLLLLEPFHTDLARCVSEVRELIGGLEDAKA